MHKTAFSIYEVIVDFFLLIHMLEELCFEILQKDKGYNCDGQVQSLTYNRTYLVKIATPFKKQVEGNN